MSRIAITLAVIAAFGGLAYYVFTHPDRQKVRELESEYQELKRENDELARNNAELEQEIRALRNDPRVAERQARRQGGLARPDEVIVQFGDKRKRSDLKVTLEVDKEGLRLAGEAVKLPQLSGVLEETSSALPEAELTVAFGEDVGPLRREQVRQAVEASSLAPADYREQ